MTILIAFHSNHYRNFKSYYLDHVAAYWSDAFPNLPSYQRFVEWIPSTLIPFCVYLKHCCGQCTGISFADSTHENHTLTRQVLPQQYSDFLYGLCS